MSSFIQDTDYKASIHDEIVTALVRDDREVVEICEDRAIAEMRSYLSGRYDCEAIFNATGSDRHPLILMVALDITIFHLFCVHNPQKLSQIRKDRYDRAIEWLLAVSKNKANIEGAPLLTTEELKRSDDNILASNQKRTHHQ